MQKIFPLLLSLILLAGCTGTTKSVTDAALHNSVTTAPITGVKKVGGLVSDTVTDLLKPSEGYLLFLTVMEINTNMSSLVIDKTKEKVEDYNASVIKQIEPGRFFYFMPPRITHADGKYEFDTELNRRIRNFMTIGQYGIPVESAKQAEYIVVINIKESVEKRHGTNSSEVAFSIMDKMDYPVFAATVRMESSSDVNFWYHSEKDARPVKELTMKALSYIMANALPEAHGDQETLKKDVKEYLAKILPDKEQ